MSEKEQEIRHNIEDKLNYRKVFRTRKSVWFGFFIGIAILACGTYLTLFTERTVIGMVFGVTTGLVGAIVIRKTFYPNKSA